MAAEEDDIAQAPSRVGVAFRAACWLAFLAPFFYLSYGTANWLAASRDGVGSIVFSWERSIPFLAWTIVPYWSINLFYALTLFFNRTTGEVDRAALRYLTAQLVAVTCFILFPLTATFTRPETTGLPGFMFAVLGGFDKPFNQAPSLHIALLVIVWEHWRLRLGGAVRIVWHLWCLLIGLSVLTTWQHHFIDIPSGALLGLFALWLFPHKGPLSLAAARLTPDRKARRLATFYALGAAACLLAAVFGAYASASWLILLWPALALGIVALGYAAAGPVVFQKSMDGSVTLASRLLLLPYRIGARINAWVWTRSLAADVVIADGVSLGRFPSRRGADGFAAVIDLAGEFEKPHGTTSRWIAFPMLDLVPAPPGALREAADAVEQARRDGPVLVCCALGFQRSAGVVAAWLVATGRAATRTEAEQMLARAGRPVHLAPAAPEVAPT